MSRTFAVPAAWGAALALVLAACAGSSREESAPPATTQKRTTPSTQAEPEPVPITAAEKGWLSRVRKYSRRLERDEARTGAITHARMRESARLYSACEAVLRRAGDPGRFEPARAVAARACKRLRKAARLLERASAALETGGFVFAGSPEEKEFNRAFGGAIQAAENARHDLQRALERAEAIEENVES